MNIERILMRSPSVSAELQRADYQRQKEKLPQRVQMALSAVVQKKCFKCQTEKPLEEFYRHPQMGDGHLGKCKECTKSDSAARLKEKRDYVREYDAWRQRTESRKAKKHAYCKRHKERYPEKAAARQAVANALRSGKLTRLTCEVCGDFDAEAHHADYSKPLDVQWLCFKHHREVAHGQIVG